eukprot:4333609-Karenia_brevis.AAC.1
MQLAKHERLVQQPRNPICRNQVLKCMLHGSRRDQFVDALEDRLQAYQNEWQESVDKKSPSHQYHIIRKCVYEVMRNVFPKSKTKHNETLKQ